MESRNEPRKKQQSRVRRPEVSRVNSGENSTNYSSKERKRRPTSSTVKNAPRRPLTEEEKKRRALARAKRRRLEREQQENPRNRKKQGQSGPRKKPNHSRPVNATSKKEVSKGKKVISTLWNILFYLFTLGLIATSLLFVISKQEDKTIFGYRIFGVLTGSMIHRDKGKPNGGFYPGDVIIVKDIPGDLAKVGDIVTYHPSIESKAFLTHRVVEKLDGLDEEQKGTYYITQGDANKSADMPVSSQQIVGKKVFTIPKIGSVLKFIRDNFIVSVIFIVSLFGFIYVMRLYFFKR